MNTILTGTQSRYRDSYAYSPQCGLVVRANGEEQVQVLDSNGKVYPAGITAPTVVPSVADGGSGTLTNAQYCCYVYVYAAKGSFPLVNSPVAINGSLAPRSNPSPANSPFQITGSGTRKNTVTVTYSPVTWIDTIWIFRTYLFATSVEASTAATAGDCYFVGEVANVPGTGTTTFTDNSLFGTTAVELDNYLAPQFQYVTYYDPYYYGWGNNTFIAACSYATTGIVTLTGTDTWFTGRNGQFATIANVITGGTNGQGLFYFKWLSSTTCQLVDAAGASLTLSGSGTSTITIQGAAATLYRSKIQNPMGWGDTEYIDATSTSAAIRIPSLTAIRVGGGYGTAIAVVPDQALLKLDAEFPASCYTYNLQTAGQANFTTTKRLVSNIFSVTSHFSQYSAVNSTGRVVLRGMDYKNFNIIESDGLSQLPISTPIPLILRRLSTNRGRQLLTHGLYDPYTELNCMWVSTYDSPSPINLLIYEHAPTGFWGIVEDYDILCSASIQDTTDGTNKTYVGTQSGILGQAFVDGTFNNWLPPLSTGLIQGSMASATSNSFVRAGSVNFDTVSAGIVGNWCMITDPNGLYEQWGRISSITSSTIYFDMTKSYTGSSYILFDPVPQAGWLFYIGMIDVRLLKYFDFNTPSTDKKIEEIWLTAKNHTNTSLRLYRERQSSPYATMQVTPNSLTPDSSTSDAMFSRTKIPATLLKTVGLEVVDRSYSDWQLANLTIKATMEP